MTTFSHVMDSLPEWQLILLIAFEGSLVLAVWLLSMYFARSSSSKTRLFCGTGLYLCYILGACLVFIMAIPTSVENLVESATIPLADAPLCTAVLISVVFAIFNLLALACVVGWFARKGRTEMSELDKMKLEDL